MKRQLEDEFGLAVDDVVDLRDKPIEFTHFYNKMRKRFKTRLHFLDEGIPLEIVQGFDSDIQILSEYFRKAR